jgi:hypothetical protein
MIIALFSFWIYVVMIEIENNDSLPNSGTDPPGGRNHSPFNLEAGCGRKGVGYLSVNLCVISQQLPQLLSVLKQVTPNNVDIAKVAPNYHLYTPSEVEAVIARLWNSADLFVSMMQRFVKSKDLDVGCMDVAMAMVLF